MNKQPIIMEDARFVSNYVPNALFEKKIPIKKVNISVVIFVFTVMFLIYVPTKYIIK